MNLIRLGLIANIIQGGKLKLSGKHFVEDGFPAYGAGGINGYLGEYEFDQDGVILSANGARCGKCFYAQGKWASLANTQIILPDIAKANPKFLWYQLNDERKWRRAGTAQPFIKPSDVKNKEIFLPDIKEQNRIVGALDAVDALRQKRKQSLQLLDAFLRATFLDMFGDPEKNDKGWEIQEFDYFAIIDTKMTVDFKKYSEYPHIGIANIEKDTGILSGYQLVKAENLISGKYVFTPEHIIYSKIRPNLNKVALPDFHGLSSADSYPILVKKGRANRIFFAFLLRSSFFIDFILKHSKRTNIPKANKEQIRKFRGIAPPIDLQNKFSQIYEQAEQTKQKMQASLAELDNQFNALTQRYFG